MHGTCSPSGRWILVIAIALAATSMPGCADPKKPYPVNGRILFDDGQPARELADYLVTFESAETHVSSVGVVGEDGTFHLKTMRENDGAIPGRYRVTLMPPLPPEMRADVRLPKTKGTKGAIDSRYETTESTDLTATVEPKTNDITLTVKRAKKS